MKAMIFVVTAMILVSVSGRAQATHKNWYMKDPGISCRFEAQTRSADAGGSGWGELGNFGGSGRWAICPVTLAGRWGSSGAGGYGFPVDKPRWGNAMYADVYIQHWSPSGTTSCQAIARMSDQQTYFSRVVDSQGAVQGAQRLAITSAVNSWGPNTTLELNKLKTLKSLDYECFLNAGDRIEGYKAQICQNFQFCDDGAGDDVQGDVANGASTVQVSASQCSVFYPNRMIDRNMNGMINNETFADIDDFVSCPLPPPADDSYDHNRGVWSTRVFLKPNTGSVGCVDAGTCPKCLLIWRNKLDPTHRFQSAYFQFATDSSGNRYLEQQDPAVAGGDDPIHMGRDININVQCQLPAGASIRGITAVMSKTAVSGGI
jgi:hypothetical protein